MDIVKEVALAVFYMHNKAILLGVEINEDIPIGDLVGIDDQIVANEEGYVDDGMGWV